MTMILVLNTEADQTFKLKRKLKTAPRSLKVPIIQVEIKAKTLTISQVFPSILETKMHLTIRKTSQISRLKLQRNLLSRIRKSKI